MIQNNYNFKKQNEDLIDENLREIISYRAHWTIRMGSSLFFIILLLLISITFLVKSPDIVKGPARIVALNAPKIIASKKAGKILFINVTNGQNVFKGQHLAIIESNGNYEEIMSLVKLTQLLISEAENGNFQNIAALKLPPYNNLGEIQTAFQEFNKYWLELNQFYENGYYKAKKLNLLKDLIFTNQLDNNLKKIDDINKIEHDLQTQEFKAYELLSTEKIIAPLDLNKFKNSLLQKEQTILQNETQYIANEILRHNKQKELLDLKKLFFDFKQKVYTSLLLLKVETEKWTQQHVIVASENGKIYFISPIQPNEEVVSNQELFYVQPDSAAYYAQFMAGQAGLGKVEEGQIVQLNVENYPSEEYGYLKGLVSSISGLPNRRDSFMIGINLPDGLTTVYKKNLFFRNNMLAKAEIITEDKILFERFFDPIKFIWNK